MSAANGAASSSREATFSSIGRPPGWAYQGPSAPLTTADEALLTDPHESDVDIVPNRVAGYRVSNGRILNQDWVSPTFNQTADGYFLLSLEDFLAWERGVRARALLKPESWSQIFAPVVLKSGKAHPYGFAWEITRKGGQTVHGHDGSFRGFEAILTRYIEEELTIIALANLADADLTRVTERIAKLMRQVR